MLFEIVTFTAALSWIFVSTPIIWLMLPLRFLHLPLQRLGVKEKSGFFVIFLSPLYCSFFVSVPFW